MYRRNEVVLRCSCGFHVDAKAAALCPLSNPIFVFRECEGPLSESGVLVSESVAS